MEQNTDQPQQPSFQKSRACWRIEISGLVARVNDAAAVVAVDSNMPHMNDIISDGARNANIRTFHEDIRRLFSGARQILPKMVLKDVDAWISATNQPKQMTNMKLVNEGIALSTRIQEYFYKIGLKDIDEQPPTEFPFEFYRHMLEDENE